MPMADMSDCVWTRGERNFLHTTSECESERILTVNIFVQGNSENMTGVINIPVKRRQREFCKLCLGPDI